MRNKSTGVPVTDTATRITDLTPEDCNDAECFEYCGQQIWNGF